MDGKGCLDKSKHVKARASHAFGFLPGGPGDFIEVQALVKLPKYGDRPGIKAPYLPRQKLSQLVGIVSNMHEIDISDLTFEINCAIPGGRPYRETLDLPLAMSMLSSYFQTSIPMGTLLVGELDLFQTIRPISNDLCRELVDLLTPGNSFPLAHLIQNIYLSERNSEEIKAMIKEKGLSVSVKGMDTLNSLVELMWPDVIEQPPG
jgi:hypothetical protein